MIEKICPVHKCVVSGEKCEQEGCGRDPINKTSIYWCNKCNVPSFYDICPECGNDCTYLATDIRPVFPEERLLLSILMEKDDPCFYMDKSIWATNSGYVVNGKKKRISIKKFNSLPLETFCKYKEIYEENSQLIDYASFEKSVETFIKVNKNRYDEIVDEAISYIQTYEEKYSLEDMFVSFSGGKDSTVTSHLVNKALGTKSILHIFGDTTLEFPFTLEYKKRFNRSGDSKGIRILTAKNREKNFDELCDVVGPPSRVMRWCCTVFKTGAIQKTITSAFKDKTNILSFQGIRRSESASRSKYERESESPKISKQTVVSPIIDWIDFDVWLYILKTGIDFNEAYRLGYTRVGCWCCPNNGGWSELLSKVHMYEQYAHWNDKLISFATKIGKPDPMDYVNEGGWKARQGGNGLEAAQKSIVSFEPCATEENAFNYILQRPITEELYELFKPFGYINKELGNKRLGEVYVLNKVGKVLLVIQGRIGSNKLKVVIKDVNLSKARTLSGAEGKVQCQLTKYQMCLSCKACESICKHDAISVKDNGKTEPSYIIDSERCVRCGECVSHFNAGCYMRKVLGIKRS